MHMHSLRRDLGSARKALEPLQRALFLWPCSGAY
jgi:hypothetical protein